jgi:hypothetical protein
MYVVACTTYLFVKSTLIIFLSLLFYYHYFISLPTKRSLHARTARTSDECYGAFQVSPQIHSHYFPFSAFPLPFPLFTPDFYSLPIYPIPSIYIIIVILSIYLINYLSIYLVIAKPSRTHSTRKWWMLWCISSEPPNPSSSFVFLCFADILYTTYYYLLIYPILSIYFIIFFTYLVHVSYLYFHNYPSILIYVVHPLIQLIQ